MTELIAAVFGFLLFNDVKGTNIRPNVISLLERAPKTGLVNYLEAIVGSRTPHNCTEMVLYSLLGNVQLGSDFLVRQSSRDQGNQLLLSPGQSKLDP